MTAISSDAPFFWPSTVNDDARNNPQKTFEVTKSAVDIRALFASVGCTAIATGAALLALPAALVAIPAIFLPPSLFLLCTHFEQSRATKVLTQLAIDHFKKSAIVPRNVMDYIVREPQALNQLLKEPAINLNKIDETGNTLFNRLLYNVGDSKQKSALPSLISRIKPLNSEQIFKAWKTEDPNIVPILKDAQIGINKPDETGATPLMRAIEGHDLSLVCFLLNQGADIPKLPDRLKPSPEIQKALNQAQKWRNRGKKSVPLLRQTTSIFNIFKPAIKVDHLFKIRDGAILIRSILVGVVAYIALIPLTITFGVAGTVGGFLGGIAAVWLFHKNEWSRATKALDELAIKEFQNMFPSDGAMNYISKSPKVLQNLISRGSHMDKLDITGKTLFEQLSLSSSDLQIQAFKKLIPGLLTYNTPIDQKYEYLMGIIRKNNPEILRYLLSTNKIKAEELTPSQQFECIHAAMLRNVELIHILLQNKFDVNAKNVFGNTPLFDLLYQSELQRWLVYILPTRFQVTEALLRYNPDLQLDSLVHGKPVTKKITDFLHNNGEDRAIRQLIEQAKQS
jgi:ankyrin repeat protein